MDTAVTEDPEILSSSNGETVFVEGAEFNGVAVEGRFEEWHCVGGFGEVTVGASGKGKSRDEVGSANP